MERKSKGLKTNPAIDFGSEGKNFKVLQAEALIASSGREAGTIVPNDTGLLIECGQGMLLVTEIQRQGKKAMKTEDLLRGFSFQEEYVLK